MMTLALSQVEDAEMRNGVVFFYLICCTWIYIMISRVVVWVAMWLSWQTVERRTQHWIMNLEGRPNPCQQQPNVLAFNSLVRTPPLEHELMNGKTTPPIFALIIDAVSLLTPLFFNHSWKTSTSPRQGAFHQSLHFLLFIFTHLLMMVELSLSYIHSSFSFLHWALSPFVECRKSR